jgi:hypothetical protein
MACSSTHIFLLCHLWKRSWWWDGSQTDWVNRYIRVPYEPYSIFCCIDHSMWEFQYFEYLLDTASRSNMKPASLDTISCYPTNLERCVSPESRRLLFTALTDGFVTRRARYSLRGWINLMISMNPDEISRTSQRRMLVPKMLLLSWLVAMAGISSAISLTRRAHKTWYVTICKLPY